MTAIGQDSLNTRRTLTVAGKPVGKALAPVMDYTYSLPLEFMRRGQSYTGPNLRLRRVLNDMLAGKPIEVTVLGGSISTGAVASRKNDPVNPNDVWNLVRLYIQRNMSDGTVFINNARLCLPKFLNATSDLVFVEFIANDGSEMDVSIAANNPKARSFERLLRKVLSGPKAPAVVLMQMLVSEMAYPPEGMGGKSKRGFFATPEDTYYNLAQVCVFVVGCVCVCGAGVHFCQGVGGASFSCLPFSRAPHSHAPRAPPSCSQHGPSPHPHTRATRTTVL